LDEIKSWRTAELYIPDHVI